MDNYRCGDNAVCEREALRLLHSLGGECVGFVVHLSLLPNRQMCGKFGRQASSRVANKIASAEQEVEGATMFYSEKRGVGGGGLFSH